MKLQKYTINELVESLVNGQFEKFRFTKFYGLADLDNGTEVLFDLTDGKISDNLANFAVKVLNNLDKCIDKAYMWLNKIKPDKMYSDAFDKGFDLYGITFGDFEYGHMKKPATNGFTLTFTPVNYYPCNFTVKYHENMWPFAIEEWVL